MPGQNAVLDQEEQPVKDVAEHRQGQNPGEHISNLEAPHHLKITRSRDYCQDQGSSGSNGDKINGDE